MPERQIAIFYFDFNRITYGCGPKFDQEFGLMLQYLSQADSERTFIISSPNPEEIIEYLRHPDRANNFREENGAWTLILGDRILPVEIAQAKKRAAPPTEISLAALERAASMLSMLGDSNHELN